MVAGFTTRKEQRAKLTLGNLLNMADVIQMKRDISDFSKILKFFQVSLRLFMFSYVLSSSSTSLHVRLRPFVFSKVLNYVSLRSLASGYRQTIFEFKTQGIGYLLPNQIDRFRVFHINLKGE